MMKKHLIILTAFLLILPLFLISCKKEDNEASTGFYLYFKSQTREELYPVDAVLDLDLPMDTLIASVFSFLQTGADESAYTNPVSADISLLNFTIEEDMNLVLNLSSDYDELSLEEKVILRAALVRTLTQLEGIQTVEIRIENQPATLFDGTVIGKMHASDFTDVMSAGLNEFTEIDMKLYFSNEDGTKLVLYTESASYSNSMAKEQYILTRLLEGPSDASEGFRVFPSGQKLNSVSLTDGICTVNLSGELLNDSFTVSPEIMVYSIVNTLTELSDITGVRITIDGSSNVKLLDELNLDTTFKRNLDLIETAEP